MGNTESQEEAPTLGELIEKSKAEVMAVAETAVIVRLDETNMAIEAVFPNGCTMFCPMPIVEDDTELTTFLLYQNLLSHVKFARLWGSQQATEVQPVTVH